LESFADIYIEQLVAGKLVIDRICGDSIEKVESVMYYLFRLEFEVSNISA
jgi:hypothetical protein